MIDINKEQIVHLTEAAQRLPGRPSVCTLWRWRLGIRGVKLETVVIGSKRYTSLEALQRFAEATTLNADRDAPTHRQSVGKQPGPARENTAFDVEEELRQLGI